MKVFLYRPPISGQGMSSRKDLETLFDLAKESKSKDKELSVVMLLPPKSIKWTCCMPIIYIHEECPGLDLLQIQNKRIWPMAKKLN
jgi:hypothetical protein